MDVLNSALEILLEVIERKATFHDACKQFFAKEENKEISKADVCAFVGCCLRHHYVFKETAKSYCYDSNRLEKTAVGIAIANAVFLKRVDDDTAISFVRNLYAVRKTPRILKDFKEFYDRKKAGEPLIDSKLDKGSIQYISQRYNLPQWMCKMWIKNYSKTVAYKVARGMTKSPIQYLRYCPDFGMTKEQLLENYPTLLKQSDISPDLLVYTGKEILKRQKFINCNNVFQIPAALKILVDELPIETFKNVAIYSGRYNVLPLELSVKFNNQLKIEHLVEPNKDFFYFKNAITRFKVKGVHTFECSISQFVTAISDKLSCFILQPESSNFDRLRYDPDYFLRFDPDTLDSIIENENKALEEALPFIEDNGYLVYVISTLDKKESYYLINSFVRKHKELELITEKQYIPVDDINSTLYYAIIRKNGKNGKN